MGWELNSQKGFLAFSNTFCQICKNTTHFEVSTREMFWRPAQKHNDKFRNNQHPNQYILYVQSSYNTLVCHKISILIVYHVENYDTFQHVL